MRWAAQGPPFLEDVNRPARHADAAFLLAVRRGSPAHPLEVRTGACHPVAGLSDEQVDGLVRYIRAEQRATGIE
jgi:hypothetical protein